MCVLSMVMDTYTDPFKKAIEDLQAIPNPGMQRPGWAVQPSPDLTEFRKLIEEFREAVTAAKTVDRLTKQPDCEDPAKMQLEARVTDLEKRLDEMSAAAAGMSLDSYRALCRGTADAKAGSVSPVPEDVVGR